MGAYFFLKFVFFIIGDSHDCLECLVLFILGDCNLTVLIFCILGDNINNDCLFSFH